MPVNLNLLPENLQVSKGLTDLLKTARALSVISVVAFLIFASGVGGFFIFEKTNYDSTRTNVEFLKKQVKDQEASEQQLVLLKDRLAKIASIRGNPNASKNIENINTLFNNLSPNTTVNQANISPTKVDINLVIKSNDDLTTFIQNMKNTKLFNLVDMTSLGYSANSGFSAVVTLSNKQQI